MRANNALTITITQDLDRVRRFMVKGNLRDQMDMIDRKVDSLITQYGQSPYTVNRVSLGVYTLTQSDSPFDLYWSQIVIMMMLSDAGFASRQIEEWFEA